MIVVDKKKRLRGTSKQSLQICNQYPIEMKLLSKHETNEYHLRRLYKLSLKSSREIPQLEKPIEQQKQWIERKMNAPEGAWKTRNDISNGHVTLRNETGELENK
jgi:hypothetical protein